jgi:hypothetical protein
MRFHLEPRAADLVRRGLSPAAAAPRARLDCGPIETLQDEARASVAVRIRDEVIGDVSYARRAFARTKDSGRRRSSRSRSASAPTPPSSR